MPLGNTEEHHDANGNAVDPYQEGVRGWSEVHVRFLTCSVWTSARFIFYSLSLVSCKNRKTPSRFVCTPTHLLQLEAARQSVRLCPPVRSVWCVQVMYMGCVTLHADLHQSNDCRWCQLPLPARARACAAMSTHRAPLAAVCACVRCIGTLAEV